MAMDGKKDGGQDGSGPAGETAPNPGLGGNPLLRLVAPLAYPYRWQLAVVLLMLPISTLMATLIPYLTKVAIDDYIEPASETGDLAAVHGPLMWLVALAAGVVVVGYLADAVYVSILQSAGQRIIARLRAIVYRRTLRLPRSYFDTHPIGSVLTRVTSDTEALAESLATGALSMVADGLKTLGFLAMMFALNWRLTLVLLLIVPVLVLLVSFFQARVRRTFFVSRQALSEATGYLQECLSGIKTIQLYGAEQVAIRRFVRRNERFFRAQNSSNFYDALLFALVEGVTTLTLALMLWYSAEELLEGFLTLGVLVAFMEYIQRLLVPLREFSQQMAIMQRAMAALDHINELMGVALDPAEVLPEDTAAGLSGSSGAATAGEVSAAAVSESSGAATTGVASALPRYDGLAAVSPAPLPFQQLEFENVRFRYRSDGPEILKGITFSLQSGQTMALVGATGSGKSTVIRLLLRAYDGYEGSIRINGEELRQISGERLGAMISMVHQNVFLFQGSVAFNIGMEREGLDAARIERAARYVNAHGIIENLEGAYQFEILQGRANLSAGQGQLISLARAVAAETDLIVLDEATSSVDSVTENLIQQAVGRLYADKTVIAIAHRLSTIRNSNMILVMEAGEIAEAGSHAELLRLGGRYAALVGEIEMPAD